MEETIRARIRRLLDEGALSCEEPEGTWAGHGLGHHCIACEQVISASEFEFEVDLAGRTFRLHRACYFMWQEECEAMPTA
jgi:hypothetical protein